MRRFSESEKQIIRELVNNSADPTKNFPINLLDQMFFKYRMSYDGTLTPKLIFYRPTVQSISIDEINQIYNEIYEKSLVIAYLVEQGLIKTTQVSNASTYDVIAHSANEIPVGYAIDQDVAKAIELSRNCYVYVGETLKELVRNGFKTIDDLALEESRRQTKSSKKSVRISGCSTLIAFVALLVAVLTLLVAFLTLFATVNQNQKKECSQSTESVIEKKIEINEQPSWEKKIFLTSPVSNERTVEVFKNYGFYLKKAND